MTYVNLRLKVAEETGLSPTGDATKLGVWINESYRFIAGLRQWPWNLATKTIQTVADITTGTVSVNAGATSITFSTGPTPSIATDFEIQFTAQSDDWYLVTTHTAGQTGATISPQFVGSSNYSSKAYIVRKKFYSLASDVDKVINMKEAINDRALVYIDPRDLDDYYPDPTATNEVPHAYTLLGFDSTNNWRVNFYPTPTTIANIQYKYYLRTTDLSGDNDLPSLPTKWHQVIVFVALATYGHPYIDDSRMSMAQSRARTMLKEMISQVSPLPDKHPVIMPWDQRSGTKPRGALFPPNFPQHFIR